MSAFRGALLKPSEKGQAHRSTLPSRRGTKLSRYEILRDQIRSWWDDRFKVGAALLEIRDQRLYRDHYETFEAFCETEYGFQRAHAYRLIAFAEVKASVQMSPIGDKLKNEGQARALAPVPAAQRVDVLTRTAERGPVTAKAIGQVAGETGATKPDKSPEHLDKTGCPIPEDILEDWQRAEAFRSVLNDLQEVKLYVEKALEESDLIFREINQGAVVDLKNAWSYLRQVLPHAVCPTCQGRTREKCTVCKGRGFVSQFAYEHWIPKETRNIRERASK